MAGTAVPQEVLGLAVFVDVLSVLATVLGLLLCFMLWNHGERVSYILMLSASTTFGAVVGLIRHVDFTLNWRTIQIQRFENERHHSYSDSDMFGKADVGWRLVLSWTSIFTYNVDALLVLFWSIALFIGTWDIRIKSSSKKAMSIIFKTSAIILPAVMCAACSTEAVQRVPVAYLVTFNFLMAICLTTGSLLVIIVLLKYLQSRNLFTRFFPKSTVMSTSLGAGTMSSVATTRTRTGTDKWLIVRFSIIMICLLVFETAQIIYQIVNYERNQHDSKGAATSPDFSVEQAKIDISQDIPGTLPSIIAFLIFGTTAPFRRKYARLIRVICCCERAQRGRSRKDPIPWMMLQPKPQGEASCTSFPDDYELEGQNKPATGIRVRTEISTSSVSSAVTAAENGLDGTTRPFSKEEVRRVSFGGTTLRSHEEPATPPLAYSNPNSRRPSSPTRRHSRTLSPIIKMDGQPGSPSAQPFGSWAWNPHSRQASLSHSQQAPVSNGRRPSASPSRQASITSTYSARSFRNPSWTAPATPPRSRALPLLPELETDNPPTGAVHRRTPSSPKSPRSSKDDPLFQRPMQSPKLKNVPPVPPIPAPTDWQRDSTATIGSVQFLAEISRGSVTSQASLMFSPRREGVDDARMASARLSSGTSSTASNRVSGEGLVSTAAARSGTTGPNLASPFDLGLPRTNDESNLSGFTGAQRQQGSHSNHSRNGTLLSNSEMEHLNPSTAPHHGSTSPAMVSPPSRQSPGGWI